MPAPQHFLLVKQRGHLFYISHRAIIIPHNFPRVGLSSRTRKKLRNEPRQRLSALRSPSGRGKPDKRAGVGDGEMREKRDRCRKMQAGIIYCRVGCGRSHTANKEIKTEC